MFSVIPLPYRILAVVALVLACLGAGFTFGVRHEEGVTAKRDLARERASVVQVQKRQAVSEKVDLKYAPALTQVQVITKETVRYVPKFVRADDCALSGGFRVLHDAAARGEIPDAARIPDAAAVPAQDAAAVVADNYGTCKETGLRLEGLQEWVREQQKLNAP